MKRFTEEELNRFNSKWEQVGDCKLWTSPLDKDGYGTFYFKKKGRRAHRVAYYMSVGDIPTGMVIDHICKHRQCVSVSHLRAISVRENSLTNSNSIAAKNALKTHCKQGHLFDRKYGNQRYCSKCQSDKSKNLRKKWAQEAKSVLC